MQRQITKHSAQAEVRELTDAELEQVNGGTIVIEEVKSPDKNGQATLSQPGTMVRAGKKNLNSL